VAAVIILMGCVAALTGGAAADSQPVQESRLKAGFLYNFTRFVEWPAEMSASADAPFSICIAEDDPFGGLLEQAIRQTKTTGRALVPVRLRPEDEPRGCHVLFIGEGRGWQLAKMKARIGNGNVLTVGEGKNFAERGGIVGMVMAEDHVRLDINLTVATQSHLKISSRLLSIARVIYEPSDVTRK
jgi:hypothetical protein